MSPYSDYDGPESVREEWDRMRERPGHVRPTTSAKQDFGWLILMLIGWIVAAMTLMAVLGKD